MKMILAVTLLLCLHSVQAEWWSAPRSRCDECAEWYAEEKKDTAWLDEVNKLIPCPCSVELKWYGIVKPSGWKTDWACVKSGWPRCGYYHPGAYGCLRSDEESPSGARQQCCYDNDGSLLPPNHEGAGTPDKSGSFWDHQKLDVNPFKWCCKECDEIGSCQRYKEVRKGDNSHC